MTKFNEWCDESIKVVTSHSVKILAAKSTETGHAVSLVSKTIPDHYTSLDRTAQIFIRLGKPAVAKYIKEKLPTQINIKSGDLGEILCSNYVSENTNFKNGIKRLRHKDHKNMSMRGEDVLAFQFDLKNKLTGILKAEVKSRIKLSSSTIKEARSALGANNGYPSAHALSFVADKAVSEGDTKLGDALDDYTLKGKNINVTITHMFFTLCGNNPLSLIEKNLLTYSGGFPQTDVGVHVEEHQAFIKAIFKSVSL